MAWLEISMLTAKQLHIISTESYTGEKINIYYILTIISFTILVKYLLDILSKTCCLKYSDYYFSFSCRKMDTKLVEI